MEMANRKYQIRPMVCDWALDIPRKDTEAVPDHRHPEGEA